LFRKLTATFFSCGHRSRWRLIRRRVKDEAKLGVLAEAEAALAASQAEVAPLPGRDVLEVLAVDLPRLRNAPTTSDKDRKRLLRSLIADVTLTSQLAPIGNQVHIGIRWRSGSTGIVATRPAPFHSLTSVEAVEFIKRLAGHTDQEIAAELNVAGLRTGSGQPFDVTAVRWVRYVHRIPSAHTDVAPGELTIPQVAARLQVGVSAIYHWVQAGRLPSRRTASGRHHIMFTAQVEEACRQMIAGSTRLHSRTQRTTGGVAV
jgi:excisionase family DNA binding protein